MRREERERTADSSQGRRSYDVNCSLFQSRLSLSEREKIELQSKNNSSELSKKFGLNALSLCKQDVIYEDRGLCTYVGERVGKRQARWK